jgi:uncharacterized protein
MTQHPNMSRSVLLDLSELVSRKGMQVAHAVDQPGVEDPDLVFQEPLKGKLKFQNSGDLINITGKVGAALTIPCSRCLTDVRVPVDLRVEEHFPIEDVLHPKRQAEDGEDFDGLVSTVVYLDQGRPILDLDELLRQLIITEVPIRTLCQETCAGLCQQCGANRNEAACGCEDVTHHTPLAGLAALLATNGTGEGNGE